MVQGGAGAHTDIRDRGWVSRLPESWRPFALLARLDRPIGSWLLLLPGWWSIAAAAPGWAEGLRLGLLFAVGAVAMRGAGCVVNDLWDRDLDRRVARTANRPLASGAVGVRGALVWLAALCGIGLAVLLQLPPTAVLLGVLSLLPVALYPLAKRVTDWPQAVLGVVFSWAAPTGWAAATGALEAPALLFWLAGFCWTLGYDTVYAHQDRDDDALIGVRSSARALGERTRPFLVACYAGALLLWAAAGLAAGLGGWFLGVLLLPAALLMWQVRRFRADDPAGCLALFRANRDVGLAVVLAVLLGRLAGGA